MYLATEKFEQIHASDIVHQDDVVRRRTGKQLRYGEFRSCFFNFLLFLSRMNVSKYVCVYVSPCICICICFTEAISSRRCRSSPRLISLFLSLMKDDDNEFGFAGDKCA